MELKEPETGPKSGLEKYQKIKIKLLWILGHAFCNTRNCTVTKVKSMSQNTLYTFYYARIITDDLCRKSRAVSSTVPCTWGTRYFLYLVPVGRYKVLSSTLYLLPGTRYFWVPCTYPLVQGTSEDFVPPFRYKVQYRIRYKQVQGQVHFFISFSTW